MDFNCNTAVKVACETRETLFPRPAFLDLKKNRELVGEIIYVFASFMLLSATILHFCGSSGNALPYKKPETLNSIFICCNNETVCSGVVRKFFIPQL